MALARILSILGNWDLEYYRRLSSTVMPRPCKRQYCSASMVHSDSDWHFSPSDDENSSAQDVMGLLVNCRRTSETRQATEGPTCACPSPIADPTSPMINYAVSVFSSAEMKKTVSQRVPKSSSLQLRTNEPWDTMKAQFLVKISDALGQGASLDLTKYNIIVLSLALSRNRVNLSPPTPTTPFSSTGSHRPNSRIPSSPTSPSCSSSKPTTRRMKRR